MTSKTVLIAIEVEDDDCLCTTNPDLSMIVGRMVNEALKKNNHFFMTDHNVKVYSVER